MYKRQEINRKIIELLGAQIVIATKSDENGNYVLDRIPVSYTHLAQAFQLLDLEKTKKECQRILKKSGKVILILCYSISKTVS